MDFVPSIDAAAIENSFSGVVCVGGGPARAYGLAHRGLGVRNTADTRFAIASGGKGFTALTVVSLVAEGTLTMMTTARSLLGDDLPLIADDVTVEHLLAHRSGIGDYLDEEQSDLGPNDYVLSSPVQLLDKTEAFLAELGGYPTKFPAGERFSYCNSGYMVLALLAERASGVPFHELVMERVVRPAGLSDTGFLRTDEPGPRTALGYLEADGLRTNTFHLPIRGNGDGGIYTTAADVHGLWRSLFAGRIVPHDWVVRMTTPHSEAPADRMRYGLGFWLDATGRGVNLVGSDAGVSFFTSHNPETSATWTVIANTTSGAWPMVRHLRDLLNG
jgi:CubicO group peptidase (beta-lactamase class C family)